MATLIEARQKYLESVNYMPPDTAEIIEKIPKGDAPPDIEEAMEEFRLHRQGNLLAITYYP